MAALPKVSIRPCSCDQPYQDKTYGKGNRVHNLTTKTNGWRCTGCGLKK